ncbi:MAG: isomerase [Caulobacterales bacterium 32-69-10]|nr:MAG: isomerase [Caulobacterales bacterium 32-69-10]
MRQWTIDAFADRPFRGSPACVVEPFDAWPDAAWMQALAQENNQAETAFLLRTADPARFGLRWFTPAVEVRLCGHATLASAHALIAELKVEAPALSFETNQSGTLVVSRDGEGYRMDFPIDRCRPIPIPDGLPEALGAEVRATWAGQFVMAMLASEKAVVDLTPDSAAIKLIDGGGTWGPGHVIVMAPAEPGAPYDAVSRCFGPGSGIIEDPATGSAHCALAPIFEEALGRAGLRFFQAFPGRGALMGAQTRGDRVLLSGRAVTVLDSRLRL